MSQFTQHENSQATKTNPNVKPVSDYFNERGVARVQGAGGTTHAHGDIQPAKFTVRAEYKAPKRRGRDNPDLKLCSYDGCRAYPLKGRDICVGHARSEGTLPSQSKDTTDEAE